ncbi:MAG: replicative DNA helicase [Acetobacteraceae bacterium]|nr:replicative DNA helicase [Acetobacteraceae bacterium]
MARDELASLIDAEAERSVLGACLLDPAAVWVVEQVLDPGMFGVPAHRLIAEVVLALADRSAPVDLVSVTAELEARGTLSQAGGPAAVADLLGAVATAANVEYHVRIVRELALRRRMAEIGEIMRLRARDRSEDLTEILDTAEQEILGLDATPSGGPVLLDDVLQERVASLVARRADPPDSIPTGFVDLDNLTGGLQRGALAVLAARPSQGKSLLAQQVAGHAARHGLNVAFFSAEMGRDELADRLAAQWTGIDIVRLRNRQLSDSEWQRLQKASQTHSIGSLWVDDTTPITTREIRARSRRLHARQKLDLIVVDYLQFLADQPASRNENRNDVVGRMTRTMKGLARELRAAVLLISQLSRAPERRASRRPALADLRDSGNIEQDADLVLLLHRPTSVDAPDDTVMPEEAAPGLATVIVAKARNGPTGEVELRFDPTKGFQSVAKDW